MIPIQYYIEVTSLWLRVWHNIMYGYVIHKRAQYGNYIYILWLCYDLFKNVPRFRVINATTTQKDNYQINHEREKILLAFYKRPNNGRTFLPKFNFVIIRPRDQQEIKMQTISAYVFTLSLPNGENIFCSLIYKVYFILVVLPPCTRLRSRINTKCSMC